ncbi:hypothetical protein N8A98_07535 [Devosia neptuniae]|uniref:Lipoprotein n=1 Tax=Devosia neptuniae TaxID=191302 RepID=A0ABY6CG04_9HYPH|nr:hypothetical protein [Devosia neptuniae]UXN71027.1 hypothetical protein N8A98_07535 [Devosia neptuniae]
MAMPKLRQVSSFSRALALAGLLFLSGCSQPPDEPHSLYFGRLIAHVQTGKINRADLLSPRQPDSEANIVRDLMADGFETRVFQDSHPELMEHVTCDGVQYRAVRGFENEGYSQRFFWGNPLSTNYAIDVTVTGNCNLIEVFGGRMDLW